MTGYTPIKNEIEVYEGDDISIDFVSSLGDLTGYTVKLQARISMESRYAIIDVSGVVTDATTGKYSIVFPSLETLGKGQSKPYFYDIKLTSTTGKIHTDRQGELYIEPRTTDLNQQSTLMIYGVDIDKDGQVILKHSQNLNFVGSGVTTRTNSEGGVDVVIDRPASAPTLALQFAGIYDDLKSLTDAIPKPTDNMQAIVIAPSEKYYHVVANQWVELAPVGSVHSGYVGAYDTVQDLETANPSPSDASLAIVGTVDRSFYIYASGSWTQVVHTDLPSLKADLTDLQAKVSKAQSDISGHDLSIGKNTQDIAAIYAPTKSEFEGAVHQLVNPITAAVDKNTASQAQQSSEMTRQGALLSNLDTKTSTLSSNVDSLRSDIHGSFVSFSVDDAARTITFTTQDGSTHLCDISGMFGGAPTVQEGIYYGFSSTKAPNELTVKSGSHQVTHTLNGVDIKTTRTGTDAKYTYFWKPDTLPDVKGFNFGGFNDVWQHAALTVDGKVGKVYVSDNPTHATDVEYEVTV